MRIRGAPSTIQEGVRLAASAFFFRMLLACSSADPQAASTLRFFALGDQGTGNHDYGNGGGTVDAAGARETA